MRLILPPKFRISNSDNIRQYACDASYYVIDVAPRFTVWSMVTHIRALAMHALRYITYIPHAFPSGDESSSSRKVRIPFYTLFSCHLTK
jgi:hypothetical protein